MPPRGVQRTRTFTITYHDDPDLDVVLADDALLGAWMRMRLVADKAWPSAAEVPRQVSEDGLTRLGEAGQIVRLPGDRFRMPGIDRDRDVRVEQGRAGGTASVEGAKRDEKGRFLPRPAQRPAERDPPSASPTPVQGGLDIRPTPVQGGSNVLDQSRPQNVDVSWKGGIGNKGVQHPAPVLGPVVPADGIEDMDAFLDQDAKPEPLPVEDDYPRSAWSVDD